MKDKCEVCGKTPPPGHRFCDNCWPDAAIKAGKAFKCASCGKVKTIDKLRRAFDGTPLCDECSKVKLH